MIDLQEHLPRMYRVALRIVGDPHTAEDVVQNACASALRRPGQFEGRSLASTWLHQITVNCAVDQLRRKGRETFMSSDVNGALDGMIRCTASNTDRGIEHRELCRLAAAMLEALPDDCRSAFVLTQVDGYSYDEAAAIEDLPRGTVASRVSRAKRLLMEQLRAQTHEWNKL